MSSVAESIETIRSTCKIHYHSYTSCESMAFQVGIEPATKLHFLIDKLSNLTLCKVQQNMANFDLKTQLQSFYDFNFKQECIPVGCVPPAAVTVSCHACPLSCMPCATHAPHAHPLPCMPPATHAPPTMHAPFHIRPPIMHAPLPCMPPTTYTSNTCPLPPVNRITDACENITLPQLRCGR